MTETNTGIDQLFSVGAHYGYSRARRHPSAKQYIFGNKNSVEIFDLEKTNEQLTKAQEFVAELGRTGKKVLFVTSKSELKDMVRGAAESLDMPFVAGRWIGGTLTNFDQIKKRVERLQSLRDQLEGADISKKHTKRERMLMRKEMEKLEESFGGISGMTELPKALFAIDSQEEAIAVAEAKKINIPVIAVANTDCDFSQLDYPVPANDANVSSVRFFLDTFVSAYNTGKKAV